MNFIKKPCAAILTALACFAVAPTTHAADASVPRQIKLTAPAAPGGGWDGASRALQQVLMSEKIVPSVQVVNVPGAGGTIGLAQFAGAAQKDGNQALMMGITLVGAVLMNKAPVGLDAVTPIARITADPLVVVVPAQSPYRNMADLAKAIKADSSKVVWAGGSAGGADHILAGLVTKAAGGDTSKLNYVPFSGGGEALAEMLGGRVTAGVSGYNEFESQIKAGKLRALAVSGDRKVEGEAAGTLKEQGLDVVLTNWRGVVAGSNITAAQRQALGAAIQRAVATPAWKNVLKTRGWEDAYLDGPAFGAFLKAEQERVSAALTSIGLVK
ncbi:C4-dicarboxylate ABC transporter substrate-binding protein [Pigmentiphaga litoralis]|uniref:Bug family tripartite tricarboxylate transporter substrate binding protein n=1 Tax=Pigmentiphaga litoralis TaxID=516702 RepID=UPI0019A03A02|nr:tripartite tricarboxylate transporter substrate-binding protein [Pigmentiphaga litoralis]GGX14666.1 C4-dicarboxylate ABC transporter substrate-binding protein [Pigmentiphaga litoralis]